MQRQIQLLSEQLNDWTGISPKVDIWQKKKEYMKKDAHCNQRKEIKIKFKNCYVHIRMAEPRQEHLEQSTGSHSGGSIKWHNYSEEHSGSFLRS